MAEHARIALKSDPEPILVDSLKDIQRWTAERNDQTTATSEHRLVHDSKLHGFVKDLGPELRADFLKIPRWFLTHISTEACEVGKKVL